MTDRTPSDPTPPPERPMTEAARARIRAELLGHAHDHRSSGWRWLVPVGAAAAVALVAGLAYWAISPGESHDGGLPATGSGTSSAPATPPAGPTTAPSPSVPSSTPSTVSETHGVMPGGKGLGQAGTGTCSTELDFVLKGAREAQSNGEVSFWLKDDRFSLCYQLDDSITVTRPLPVAPTAGVATYRVASLYRPTAGAFRAVRVAGGVVPQGAAGFEVAYTFPDGHTERAQTAQDSTGRAWWWMVYSYDDGGGNEMSKPPITVTVSQSGEQNTYSLEWGTDTCAQANHGC
jgi:hypothetical protein